MITLRVSLINLLGLYLLFSEDHSGCCLQTALQPPSPSITLQAISERQILLVRWLVNHSSLVGNFYEIQIAQTENHTVIYNRNLTIFSVDSVKNNFTWTSEVPLECVDHSVRIRHFYNQSVPSPWSSWKTNYGFPVEKKSKIFPFDRVMREHTTAMFCCVPPKGVNITSMTFNNRKYPLISIGSRVKAIIVHNLTIPKSFIKRLMLMCYDDASSVSSITWNFISFPPQKPRNISCVTSDMTTVNCTWDPGRERDKFDSNKQTHTLRIENSGQAPINCIHLNSCIFLAAPQLEEYNISVVVKDKLGEEMASYSFNLSERVFPVVEEIRVSSGVTDATVSWVVQGNLTRLNLLCQVTADPHSTTALSCNSVSGLCKANLEHLLPNTRYSTRVRCSANGRFWGEWTQPRSFATYPLVTLDVWRIIKKLPEPNSRQVTLLWTQHTPGSAVTVNVEGYKVQWSQEGQNWTKWTDSQQTQAEVTINAGQYDFTVQAILHSSFSVPAHITIPPSQWDDGVPVKKQLSSSTAAGINLSWIKQETVSCGYTVEWCTQGNAAPCTLQWLNVPENNTLSLPAGYFEAGCRYTFNIYGCAENGHRLLEIQTGYSQEVHESVKALNLVEPVQSTSSSVTLEWRYNEDDPAHPAFIIGYLVTLKTDALPGHVTNQFNVSVADPRKKSVTINGLEQNRGYAISVSALTKQGPGKPTNITIRTKTNYSAHLAKILTPILLLLGCIILLWPQRKMLKSGLQEIFAYPAGMNIKTPEFDSFLHETSEKLQSQKVEECSCCDIEILNSRPLLEETMNSLPSPGSQASPLTLSLSCVPLQADYCPQSVTVSWDRPDLQQMVCISNKTYLHTVEEDDLSEKQQARIIEIKSGCEPSENLLESCSVVYGYISSDNL
ncbi:leukemia inhibitory factor receptor [Plectropomus leopardus]|uniref:leukemia inhibitory factor receptor n=1 Tax=Plectropomus leopardus TaxID=160734 RepID=UPI001C4B6195|nr:leukemia inhibitory factor receptor [Plectropomus leopardus]